MKLPLCFFSQQSATCATKPIFDGIASVNFFANNIRCHKKKIYNIRCLQKHKTWWRTSNPRTATQSRPGNWRTDKHQWNNTPLETDVTCWYLRYPLLLCKNFIPRRRNKPPKNEKEIYSGHVETSKEEAPLVIQLVDFRPLNISYIY